MGYETKLIIGIATDQRMYDEKAGEMTGDYRWFFNYAEVDLCNTGDVFRTIKDGQKMYYYVDGDDKPVTEDCYSDNFYAHPIWVVIEQLEKSDTTYRRHKWALALLRTMANQENEKLSVIFYGH